MTLLNTCLQFVLVFGLLTSDRHIIEKLACVAWRFWLGELSNKGGRGQRNREEIGAGETWKTGQAVFIFLAASPLFLARFAREFFVPTPLLRPARQNRHATQAIEK